MFIRILGFTCAVLILLAPAISQDSYGQLLQHWEYDKSEPLNTKQAGIEKRDGVSIYDISFSSPVGDRGKAVGPNAGTVTAYLIVPAGRGPFPAVIFGHWCMPGSEKKNRTEFLDEAVLLAHSGVISLLPDHVSVRPGFVEDTAPLSEQDSAVEVQQDVNLRRGADLLLARLDVDPSRLAYVGHSCDGSAGGFLSGIDKRFKAFVLMAGELSDEVDAKSEEYKQYREKIGPEKFDAFVAQYAWLDPGKFVSHAAPATIFLQYATKEDFLTPARAHEYEAVVSEPKKFKLYEAPHALNSEARRDRIAFLTAQLKLKALSSALIDSVPDLPQPPAPKD